MAPRSTRSKPTPADPPSPEKATAQLARNEDEQRRLFILPRHVSTASRVVSLPNPGTAALSRYFFCPEKDLFEFSKIGASQNTPRSWLITGTPKLATEAEAELVVAQSEHPSTQNGASSFEDGYVLQNADLFIATPMDPVFFLLPLFKALVSSGKGSFRLGDDYIDTLSESSTELGLLLRLQSFQSLVLERLKAVSATQELGDDCLYKPDAQLLAQELVKKAQSMTKPSVWPLSMEETFVKKQLEIPIASVGHGNPQLPTPEQSMTEADAESGDSQSQNTTSLETLAQEENGTEAIQPQLGHDTRTRLASQQVTELMRIRVALKYILSSYFPIQLREQFEELVSSSKYIDFTPLDQHLAEVQRVKEQVQALRSLSDNISRKRGAADDDEAAELRAEKKRRKEEEEKKKKAESRASKELKKVDVSGMKKLSSFFTKSAASAKK